MGAEHCKTPIENNITAGASAPPGFAYLSSFFLKKVEHREGNLSFHSSKDSSTKGEAEVEAFGVEKLKKSLGSRPWMLNDKINQFAKENPYVQPDKPRRRQCLGNGKGDVLEEAPVFRPSEEEFSDTLKYIESIHHKAEPYGLCRIIPPPSWQPPCVIKEKRIWEYSKFVAQIQQFDRFPTQSETDEEPGLEFTLQRFKKHADDFTEHYFFSRHKDVVHHANYKQGELSVESIEDEYRKIVENPTEKLEVLYGDIDTAAFGSGFPMASNPRESTNYDSYIRSSWNLNNVPTLPGSLLSFECEKIPGVLVPQLRIGMCFSSLFWKVEKHHLYSVCYMHVGSPKIWYCAPARYSFKFETLMNKYFPDLPGKQFKLHEGMRTRLSPFILKSEGVPVYRCIQYPREFVLVFPGAYHSTFDSGFNVAEAVNFPPIDWLPHGLNAVAFNQSRGWKMSISFDKLLIGAAREAVKAQWELSILKKDTIDNKRWKGYCGKNGILAETLKLRVKQESMQREYLCGSFQTKRKDKNFNATGKRECCICYTDLYLSAAHCPCSSDRFSCLNHAKRLCSCTWTKRIFLYHYEISELNILVEAVEGKLSAVHTWARDDLNLGLRHYASEKNSFTKDKGQKRGKLEDAGTSYGDHSTAPSSIKAEIKARIQQSQCLSESKEKMVTTPLNLSMSSSSELDDTTDDFYDGGKGSPLSAELRGPRKRDVRLSKQKRAPKREVALSELLKDISSTYGTKKHLKSTLDELPMSQPSSKKRKK